VLALEPRADRERAVDVVEQARVGAPEVDDRDPVEVVGLVDAAAAIRVRQGRPVGLDALGLPLGVDVGAADPRVDVRELRRADLALLQRLQAVLDADVVERAPRSRRAACPSR
jgi:hypothetical protein